VFDGEVLSGGRTAGVAVQGFSHSRYCGA
jgi:hypothetical protein